MRTACCLTVGLMTSAVAMLAACGGTVVLRVDPPDSRVTVDGRPLDSNWFEYGRWIGNEYTVVASAPGYEAQERKADVHLGSRCALIAFYSLISVFGAPIALTCPWQGQMEDELKLTLRPVE